MHKDVDDLFRSRLRSSALTEGYICGLIKLEGFWALLSPETNGAAKLADIYVRTPDGKTISHLEVKGRNIQFSSREDYPYATALLATKNAHAYRHDYAVVSADGNVLVSLRDSKTRLAAIARDNARGAAGVVYQEPREHLVSWSDYCDELKRRVEK
jgi:hypothetical protein